MTQHTQSPNLNLIQEIQQFLIHEANLLDDRDFEAWQALFAMDGIYWVPSNADDIDPNTHVSIVYDNLEGIGERVWRLRSGLAWAQDPPSKTMHQLSNIAIGTVEEGEITVSANMVIYDYRHNHHLPSMDNIVTYPARCEYRLREKAGGYEIVLKKVKLLNNNGVLGNVGFIM